MTSQRLESGPTFVTDPGVHCKCGNYATHMVEMHLVDYCTPTERTRTEFKCGACTEKAYVLAQTLLMAKNSGLNFCTACHLTFVNLCDIIVTLWPIVKKGKG